MTLSAEDRRIRGLRPPKPAVDPWRPLGTVVETERRPGRTTERTLTVFLAGSECPFTCGFCDLWRHTLDGPTPPGALPAQLRLAFGETDPATVQRVKLYNASNFFDPRAVPPDDLGTIAGLVAPFAGVTVESHARTIGSRCADFAGRLKGRLEVAIGLETIHPGALPKLNKKMDLGDFARAARRLREQNLDLRAFVLVGTPFVPAEESRDWSVRSVSYAFEQGAALVALIPARGGNGEMERLAATGEFRPPGLSDLEAVLERSLRLGGGVVVADLWDAERLAACPACRVERVNRIRVMNDTGQIPPAVECAACRTG